jgi:uncharacterized protein YjaZ
LGVVNTKKWLSEYGDSPIKLCEKLVKYFNGNSKKEIYEYLYMFGMYKPSMFSKNDQVKQLTESNYWQEVDKLYTSLKVKFKGPDIPIFIFPINQRHSRMMEENKGKSGLAFSDKLFLFLSDNLDATEIKALLTHEYHHVCRLSSINKQEKQMTLLDTIILEGMAEYAVKEECGEEYNAFWTKLYKEEQLKNWYKEIIYPNKDLTRTDLQFQEILYGFKGYPRMLGYSVGYFLINQLLVKKNHSLQSIEKMTSYEISKKIH